MVWRAVVWSCPAVPGAQLWWGCDMFRICSAYLPAFHRKATREAETGPECVPVPGEDPQNLERGYRVQNPQNVQNTQKKPVEREGVRVWYPIPQKPETGCNRLKWRHTDKSAWNACELCLITYVHLFIYSIKLCEIMWNSKSFIVGVAILHKPRYIEHARQERKEK